MKKIGEGWQYSVYDLENGRVLKIFHSWPKSYWTILKTIFPFKTDSFWDIPSYIKGMKLKALDSFQIIKRKNIPADWIGNPKFISELDFEQDKVVPLDEAFQQRSLDDSQKLVDQFIEFNTKLLDIGVIDKSFNISKNFGLSKNGKIILIDIGELHDDPSRVREQRESRAWSKHYITDHIKDEKLKAYFISEMDKKFGL